MSMSSDDTLARLAAVIESRKGGDPDKSYVARLFAKGQDAILKKVGEEATETVMACKDGVREKIALIGVRAAELAGDGERDPGRARVLALGQPQVGHERLPVGGEEDVLRLEVAVDDPPRVGPAQRLGQPGGEPRRLLDRQRPPAELVTERATAHEGHDEVRPLRRLAVVEERDEALGEPERGLELALAREALDRLPARLAQELDRHVAPVGRPAPLRSSASSSMAMKHGFWPSSDSPMSDTVRAAHTTVPSGLR